MTACANTPRAGPPTSTVPMASSQATTTGSLIEYTICPMAMLMAIATEMSKSVNVEKSCRILLFMAISSLWS